MALKEPFRIALFIDGFTLKKVNEYYRFHHPYHCRLDFHGVKNWAKQKAQKVFSVDEKSTAMECHYYHPHKNPRIHGGGTAGFSCFERELRSIGFQIHYAEHVAEDGQHPNMALMQDALLFASYRRIDAVVLFSTQGQYAPLPDKLRAMGIPVLLLGWNFTYPKENRWIHWKTDSSLKDSSAYYIAMDRVAKSMPPQPDLHSGFFLSTPRGACA